MLFIIYLAYHQASITYTSVPQSLHLKGTAQLEIPVPLLDETISFNIDCFFFIHLMFSIPVNLNTLLRKVKFLVHLRGSLVFIRLEHVNVMIVVLLWIGRPVDRDVGIIFVQSRQSLQPISTFDVLINGGHRVPSIVVALLVVIDSAHCLTSLGC